MVITGGVHVGDDISGSHLGCHYFVGLSVQCNLACLFEKPRGLGGVVQKNKHSRLLITTIKSIREGCGLDACSHHGSRSSSPAVGSCETWILNTDH